MIVDNASADGSVERLCHAYPQATVIEMPDNRGFAAGVNAGFRHSSAELVIVLNPDTEVRAGALQGLVAHLCEHSGTGVLAPLLEDADGRLAPNGYRRFPSLFTLGVDLCVPLTYALAHCPALHPYVMSPAALRAGDPPAHVGGAVMTIRRGAYDQAGPLTRVSSSTSRRPSGNAASPGVAGQSRYCPPRAHVTSSAEEGTRRSCPRRTSSRRAARYPRLQGVPVVLSRIVLSISLALSWATLRVIACLPSKRSKAAEQARAYGLLLRRALSVARAL